MATLSRAQRLQALVATLAETLGRGATIHEIRDAWAAAESAAAPASLTAEVGSLLRRGLVVHAGGRPGFSEYAPQGFASRIDAARRADDVECVFQACAAAVTRLERPVTT